jgi:hypothetical protein
MDQVQSTHIAQHALPTGRHVVYAKFNDTDTSIYTLFLPDQVGPVGSGRRDLGEPTTAEPAYGVSNCPPGASRLAGPTIPVGYRSVPAGQPKPGTHRAGGRSPAHEQQRPQGTGPATDRSEPTPQVRRRPTLPVECAPSLRQPRCTRCVLVRQSAVVLVHSEPDHLERLGQAA